MENIQRASPPNENPFDFGQRNQQVLSNTNRKKRMFLSESEKYFFEKQLYLNLLKHNIISSEILPPSSFEMNTLSFGIKKLYELNHKKPFEKEMMPNVIAYLSRFLSGRTPNDCAKIWTFMNKNYNSDLHSEEKKLPRLPETIYSISFKKQFDVVANERDVAFFNKDKVVFTSLDSDELNTFYSPSISRVMLQDGVCFVLTNNISILKIIDKKESTQFLKFEKPVSEVVISSGLTTLFAAKSTDSETIIFGDELFQNEILFYVPILQFEICSSLLCLTSKDAFIIIDHNMTVHSYDYLTSNIQKFTLKHNEKIVIAYNDFNFEVIDFSNEEEIFSQNYSTNDHICDCQISDMYNLLAFSYYQGIGIYDLKNPSKQLKYINLEAYISCPCNELTYKMKWIYDDTLIAVATNSGHFILIDVTNDIEFLTDHQLPPKPVDSLYTTDDTIIISNNTGSTIIQMNTRPIFLSKIIT